MNDIKALSNGTFLYVAGAVVISFVLIQSVVFLIKAWKRGKEIGLSTKKMKAARCV